MLDTAEVRIEKYEDELPDMLLGVHDGYMHGQIDAETYAKALSVIHNTLAELYLGGTK